ncbi:MOSC domain-containing protein [Micromonospora sp. CPCC 206060]|uniref:MOSC domain-containing protein n=1 Tax=Micromonospora sp. CPCC 206060 TaxID=3122406 RepID=UPI002FF1E631
MTGRLLSVNLAVVTRADWAGDPSGLSGIDKRPTDGRVVLRADGVEGDFVGERAVHGGVDKAVYAYAKEDTAWWERDLGRDIPPGGLGENITTEAIDVTGAVIGERWTIGSAVLEVAQPRLPCRTFAGYWGVPDLIKRFTARGVPGAYLRVVQDGDVGAGDPVEVTYRPEHGLTLGATFRALTSEPALLPRLLLAPELPEEIRDKARRRLGAK